MIASSESLFVSSRDLEIGLARRDCPTCHGPLLIRLPSMADALADRQSAALRLGLEGLTTGERTLFDTLYAVMPRATTMAEVRTALRDLSLQGVHNHLYLLRRKIGPLGWRVVTRPYGTMRLIAPE